MDNEPKKVEEQKKVEVKKPMPSRTASDVRTPRRKPSDGGVPPPPEKFIPVRLSGQSHRSVDDIPDIIYDEEAGKGLQLGE